MRRGGCRSVEAGGPEAAKDRAQATTAALQPGDSRKATSGWERLRQSTGTARPRPGETAMTASTREMPEISRIREIEVLEDLPTARAPEVVDRVTVTVLFTDIVGSTALLVELGDRLWCELLSQHHQVVREQLAAHEGREIDTAETGSSRPSTARPRRSAARKRSVLGSATSACGCDSVSTRASARCWTASSSGSPCTSEPVSQRRRMLTTCWSQRRSRNLSLGQESCSRAEVWPGSRACQGSGNCSVP